ncbi:MAG: hypothetical protein RLZZ338_1542 [Cyanobacteriota bacterium]
MGIFRPQINIPSPIIYKVAVQARCQIVLTIRATAISTFVRDDRAFHKPTAPVKYFAAIANGDLGIIKTKRKANFKLIVAPYS